MELCVQQHSRLDSAVGWWAGPEQFNYSAGTPLMSHAAGAEAPDFGRRMSLSSLGGRKYGRAGAGSTEPSGHGHSLEPRAKGSAKLLVRHIPIVVEAEQSEDEVSREPALHHHDDCVQAAGEGGHRWGQARLVTQGPSPVPIDYSWSVVYTDRYVIPSHRQADRVIN